jgi:hypothetical protein
MQTSLLGATVKFSQSRGSDGLGTIAPDPDNCCWGVIDA